MAEAKLVFYSFLKGNSNWNMLVDRDHGSIIMDQMYFGPTHEALLKDKKAKVQGFTTVSAKMDKAVSWGLSFTEIYEDKRGNCIYLKVPSSSGAASSYTIAIGGDDGEYLRIAHECKACEEEGSKGETVAHCYHIPLAVMCWEAVRKEDSEMRRLIKKVFGLNYSPEKLIPKESELERHYLRLLDEVYYVCRHTRRMDEHFELFQPGHVEYDFEKYAGKKIELPDGYMGCGKNKAKTVSKQPKKEKIDWSAYKVKGRRFNSKERKLIPQDVFYVSRKGEEKLACEILKGGDPLLLIGPSATGKSRLAMKAFSEQRLRLPVLTLNASEDRDYFSLIESTKLNEQGTYEVEAKILQAAERGYGLILNEVASLRPGTGIILNGILAEREIDLGDRTVKLHRDTRICATCNEGSEYTGSVGLDPSTFDRFVPIYLDYLDEDLEVEVVAKESGNEDVKTIGKMARVARLSRMLHREGELHKPITTRDLIRWAKYSRKNDPLEIAELILTEAIAKDEAELLAVRNKMEEVFAE